MIRQIFGAAIAIAGMGLSACGAQTTPPTAPSSQPSQTTAPSESTAAPAKPESSKPKQESTRAPVNPVPAESRTPEEAAARAADPKDPSGALIIKTPGASGAKP